MVTRALTLYSAEVEDQTTVTGKLLEHIVQGLNKGIIAGCCWMVVGVLPPLDPVLYNLGVTPCRILIMNIA